MSDDVSLFEDALRSLDPDDRVAVRNLASQLEALGDPNLSNDLCGRSRALRVAIGQLRGEALTELLAHEEHDEFIRRASDAMYMSPVDVESLRVPRYVAVERHECACGAALMIPYARQGGPGFPLDCPTCRAAYLARPVYESGEYRVTLEQDLRPAKKRKRKVANG